MIPALLILLNVLFLAACCWLILKMMSNVLRDLFGRKGGPQADWHPPTIVPLRPPPQGNGMWWFEVSLLAAIVLLSLASALGLV